jgi:hypothetical protein
MQVAMSKSPVMRKRAGNLKISLNRTSSMMGAKRKKMRVNVFKKRRGMLAPVRK